jgi:NIMA (never in mitosis gene a)-related kinase 1/4/5
VWRDLPYDSKSDIWSLGCVMYETVALVPPFRAKDMNSLYKKVVKGIFDEAPSNFNRDLLKLIYSMIKIDPKNRPTCDEILRLPFV